MKCGAAGKYQSITSIKAFLAVKEQKIKQDVAADNASAHASSWIERIFAFIDCLVNEMMVHWTLGGFKSRKWFRIIRFLHRCQRWRSRAVEERDRMFAAVRLEDELTSFPQLEASHRPTV